MIKKKMKKKINLIWIDVNVLSILILRIKYISSIE